MSIIGTDKMQKINAQTYNLLNEDQTIWYCVSRSKDLFPLSSLTENDFHTLLHSNKNKL